MGELAMSERWFRLGGAVLRRASVELGEGGDPVAAGWRVLVPLDWPMPLVDDASHVAVVGVLVQWVAVPGPMVAVPLDLDAPY